jgi:aminoglycoside N3'-acetyltransferase
LAQTPCGVSSPYARLIDADAKILMAGVGIEPLTFFHTIEELLEPEMPFSPFTADWVTAQVRDAQGRIHTCKFRLFEPGISKRRNLHILVPKLQELGGWHAARVGRLRLILLEARNVLEAGRSLARQGVFCYRD